MLHRTYSDAAQSLGPAATLLAPRATDDESELCTANANGCRLEGPLHGVTDMPVAAAEGTAERLPMLPTAIGSRAHRGNAGTRGQRGRPDPRWFYPGAHRRPDVSAAGLTSLNVAEAMNRVTPRD